MTDPVAAALSALQRDPYAHTAGLRGGPGRRDRGRARAGPAAGPAGQATTRRTGGGPPEGRPYGRLFWVDEVAGQPAFFAGGYAGQHVLVVPGLGLTLVTTGEESRLLPDWRWRPGLEVTRELAARLR